MTWSSPRDEPAAATETGQLAKCESGADAHASSSYKQILHSSVLIGGSSAIGLAISLVRTKAMAMLLGPAGVGLMGAFTVITDLARSVAEMGINGSGVRQIAESAATGDQRRIVVTATILRRVAVVLGIIGAVLLALSSSLVATFTFGTTEHAGAIALLSLAVLLRLISDGQGALLQGMRRIGDLARMNVFGSAIGVLVTIALVYWLREDGIAPSLVAIAAASLLVSWWYSRRVSIGKSHLSVPQVKGEVFALLRLGVIFMASGILMMGAAYLVRIIVIRYEGLDAAGLYQSAWAIGGLFVGFVLQAMGADFYPRLVGAATDNPTSNRLVNEQTQVGVLLAGPGVVATIALAALVLPLLYTSAFAAAADTLRWICLGMALRVVTWPIGYIIVARAQNRIFFLTELAWTIVNIGLSWVLVLRFGTVGAGMAFFASYVFHGLMIYAIVRRLSGFSWSAATVGCATVQGCMIAAAFVAAQALPAPWSTVVGTTLLVGSLVHTVKALAGLAFPQQLPHPVRRLLNHVRLASRP